MCNVVSVEHLWFSFSFQTKNIYFKINLVIVLVFPMYHNFNSSF